MKTALVRERNRMTSCIYIFVSYDWFRVSKLSAASSNLCAAVSVLLDITVKDREGDDVERNNNGMIPSIFTSEYCARKFPFHICVSLKTTWPTRNVPWLKYLLNPVFRKPFKEFYPGKRNIICFKECILGDPDALIISCGCQVNKNWHIWLFFRRLAFTLLSNSQFFQGLRGSMSQGYYCFK